MWKCCGLSNKCLIIYEWSPSPNPSLLNAHQARRSPAPTGSSPTLPLPPLPLPTTTTTTMSTTSPSTSPSPSMTSPKYPSPKPNCSSAVKCCHRVSSTTAGKTLPGFNRELLMFVFSFAMVISVLVGPADAKRKFEYDLFVDWLLTDSWHPSHQNFVIYEHFFKRNFVYFFFQLLKTSFNWENFCWLIYFLSKK